MTRKGVPYAQLPPHVQRKLRTRSAAALAQPEPEAPVPNRASTRTQRRGPFDDPTHRCRQCGRTFTDWGPAERHVNAAHGGGIVELLWPDRPAPPSQGAKLVAPEPE